MPGAARLFKPYYRYEHIGVDAADVVFVGVQNLNNEHTIGIRYDLSPLAAIKTETRIRQRVSSLPWDTGWFFQVAFTF